MTTTPFAKIVAPVVAQAMAELRRRDPKCYEVVLGKSARQDLTRDIQGRLLWCLRPTLELQAEAERRGGAEVTLSLLELASVMPGVAEVIALLTEDWVVAQGKMFSRLVRDWPRLHSWLGATRVLPKIREMQTHLSDPHHHSQTVTALIFDGGHRLVYKPRSCRNEAHWFETLRLINRAGFRPLFRCPRLLDRRSHGWMEFVPAGACRSLEEVRQFYFRWGAQSYLAQILEARDLHRQNWIAAGSDPVLVDAEILGAGGAGHPLLATGLLPLLPSDGLGAYAHSPFDSRSATNATERCWPSYRRRRQVPAVYHREIARGYKSMAQFLSHEEGRQLLQFAQAKIALRPRTRRNYRATAAYVRLLRQSLQPKRLRQEGDRYAYLLEACLATSAEVAIGRMEAKELLRGSIPRFIVSRAAAQKGVVTTERPPLVASRLLRSRLRRRSSH